MEVYHNWKSVAGSGAAQILRAAPKCKLPVRCTPIAASYIGRPGGYTTILSKNTVGMPCPECERTIRKEAYMGGSIYYCPQCQAAEKQAA